MKKLVSALLALVMVLGLTAFADLPLTDEGITLKFAAPVRPEHIDYDKMWMFKKYEEMTGVHIEWDLVPDAGWTERKNLLLASEDLPDVFFRGGITVNDLLTYGVKQDFIIDLTNLIEEYAPNISAMLEQYPDVKAAITLDGKIMGLPQVIIAVGPRTNPFWINEKWLEKCGIEMPTTVDEFVNACIAFTQCDYNGDGEANEYAINLRSSSTSINNMYNVLYGMFGMCNLGANSGWLDVDENGEPRFYPTDERCKAMYDMTATLWENNCFDPDFLTQSNAQLTTKGLENQFAILAGVNNPGYCSEDLENWTYLPVLENEYGETKFNAVGSMLNNYGTFCITKACKNPEIAIQWADFFYSTAGAELVYWGAEGETFNYDENGERVYVDEILNGTMGEWLPKSGSSMPLVQDPAIVYDYSKLTTVKQMEAGEAFAEFAPKSIWYPVLTADESASIATVKTDIDSYIAEARLKFMMGELDVENDWDAYVAKLEEMGMAQYMEVYTTAYERSLGK